jgi:hypothetical protein
MCYIYRPVTDIKIKNSLMKMYGRNILNKSKTIFHYKLLHVHIVKCAFGICDSNQKTLDKVTETQVDTLPYYTILSQTMRICMNVYLQCDSLDVHPSTHYSTIQTK